MEDTVIVIMLKDRETGFLDKELGSYTIADDLGTVFNIYADDGETGREVVLRLTCERELDDWEYDAVFDYYDTDVLAAVTESIAEEDGHYNPVWVVKFPFSDSYDEMEQRLIQILMLHKDELSSVYEAIADKKDDYFEE